MAGLSALAQQAGGHSTSETMTALSIKFLRDETGQDLIEYGLLLGIITVSVLTAMNLIGPKIVAYFVDTEAALP